MKTRKEKILLAVWILAVFVIGLVASYLLFGGSLHTNKNLWRKVAAVFPVPVATVEGQTIRLKTLQVAEDLNTPNALDFVIKQKAISVLAKQANIQIPDSTVTKREQQMLSSWGWDQSKLNTELQKSGVSNDDFKQIFILPDLQADQLKIKLTQSNSKVNLVQSALQSGQDFTQVSKNYSEDAVTAPLGGDAGFLGQIDLGSDLWQKAIGLSDGQYSGPIATPQGMIFIKRLELQRQTDSNPERIHIQEILIKTLDFDSWLQKQMKQMEIKTFV